MTNANQPNYDTPRGDMTGSDRPLFDDASFDTPQAPSATGSARAGRDLEPTRDFDTQPEPAPAPAKPKVKKTTAGSMWVGLVVSAILLIVLLVFILQNQQESALHLFGWTWNFPVGVGMLFAAILGALITALIGGWRMLDLRRQIRKGNK
ncbi:MAG: LapA family protein [Corynebacterium sp.]|uniref:LapA family protein n=1 Tax=Corynebacterium sp. TaxID=1720 RepID=UPI0026DB87CA|nr:LapA family protein [Corynebacterium sp.]MDO5029282.1 LapA family protein [Corynebacterium sp.]